MKSLLKLSLESAVIEIDAAALQNAENNVSDVEHKAEIQEEIIDEVCETTNAILAIEQLIAEIEPPDGSPAPENKTAERILAVAIEQIFDSIDFDAPSFFAMEAEGEPASGINEKLAKLKEFLIKLWQRIVEAFSNLYDTISDFLSTAFNAATRLEKAAIALLRETRGLSGQPKRLTYSNKDMARRLSGDDSVGIIKLFDRTLDLTEITVQIAYSEPAKIINEIINDYMASVYASNRQDTVIPRFTHYDKLVTQIPKAMVDAYTGRFMRKDNSPVNADAGNGVDVYTTNIMMGGVVGVVCIPKTIEYLNEFAFKILPVDDDTDNASEIESEVPISDIKQQEDLLKMVIHNCGQIRRFNKNMFVIKELDTQLKQTVKRMRERILAKYPDGDRDLDAKEKEIVRTIAQVAPKIAQGIHHRTIAFSLNSCRTILKHVQYSINAYGVA